jgi:hypothetical protein
LRAFLFHYYSGATLLLNGLDENATGWQDVVNGNYDSAQAHFANRDRTLMYADNLLS